MPLLPIGLLLLALLMVSVEAMRFCRKWDTTLVRVEATEHEVARF